MNGRTGLDAFVARYGSEAPEVIWTAALAWIERVAVDARHQSGQRWQHHPDGELRRLRRELAGGLMLARLAAALQEEDNSLERDLLLEAHAAAEARREQEKRERLEAERARLRLAARHASREASR